MAQAAIQRKWTYRDYCAIPEDGRRHEILDGEHFMSPSPGVRHQRLSRRLYDALSAWLKQGKEGELFYAPLDVVLSDFDVVQPDVIWLSETSQAYLTEANVQGPPDLVVEILSPSSRRQDQSIKLDLYQRFGVREYWLVDPEVAEVRCWSLVGERFGRPRLFEASRGDAMSSPLLPGFTLPLPEFFA